MEAPPDRDFGPQPLDSLLRELGLENHDLVAASPSQLTHKQVQKARKGRFVTKNIQGKVLEALNALAPAEGETRRTFALSDLFTYRP